MQKFKENAGVVALLLIGVALLMGQAASFTARQMHDVSGPGLSGYELDAHFSNTVDLPTPIRRFRVSGGAGAVKVMYQDGTIHTIPDVQQCEVTDAHVIRIYATGTTASGLSGWE